LPLSQPRSCSHAMPAQPVIQACAHIRRKLAATWGGAVTPQHTQRELDCDTRPAQAVTAHIVHMCCHNTDKRAGQNKTPKQRYYTPQLNLFMKPTDTSAQHPQVAHQHMTHWGTTQPAEPLHTVHKIHTHVFPLLAHTTAYRKVPVRPLCLLVNSQMDSLTVQTTSVYMQ
jgi:hypothetical protein